MKLKICLSLAIMATAPLSLAQTPAAQKSAGAAINHLPPANEPAGGASGLRSEPRGPIRPIPAGPLGPQPMIQQGGPATSATSTSPPRNQPDSQGRKVCRVEGATVYYCM